MDISIIGAGPVGSYLAWQHAKRKRDIRLIEEHPSIGAPVQCTGILTQDILHYVPKKMIKAHTQHIVRETVVHGPNTKVTVPISPNYVVNNISYCQALANKAQDAGAQIHLNTRYIRNDEEKYVVKNVQLKKEKKYTTDILVGADGPTSMVAKHNGLYDKSNRSFLTGVQAVVKVPAAAYDERIHFYPHIGEYAWYCPEGEGRARIGLAAPSGAKKIFDEFIKQWPGKVECVQGGPIPLYGGRGTGTQRPEHRTLRQEHRTLRPEHKTRLFAKRMAVEKNYDAEGMRVQLIGDAVPQIKNTTGGGIIPATKAAYIHAQDPEKYARGLRKLNKELHMHYLINKMMHRFNEKDWDTLITQVNEEKVKKILEKTNRDNATRLAAQLLLKKPSMALWARKIIF